MIEIQFTKEVDVRGTEMFFCNLKLDLTLDEYNKLSKKEQQELVKNNMNKAEVVDSDIIADTFTGSKETFEISNVEEIEIQPEYNYDNPSEPTNLF